MPESRTPFSDQLRRLRNAAAMSQEDLADRTGVSRRGISDLERGLRHAPRLETVRLLADGLALGDDERQALFAAARPALLRSGLAASPASLPSLRTPLTRLIGREAELAVLRTALADDEIRLLTLTGPGGVGKTRLAIEVAGGLHGIFPSGIVFVDLSPLTNPDLVVPTIAAALGIREYARRRLIETLATVLTSRRFLLVLDNCEQVRAVAPDITILLAASPTLTVFATSREPFHVPGERQFPLLPLPLPASDRLLMLDELAQVPAITLFIERATAVQPAFALTEDTAAVVAICQRLDGLPLAIELAAAQVKVLPPAALLTRLEQRLPLLIGGARDLPTRQRTMRDAIAWSYNLLSLEEQVLFRRLAIFAGGFTLAAAEVVAAPDGKLDIVASIAVLVDSSLLDQENNLVGEPRYRMLETIREYGLEQLSIAENADDAQHWFAASGDEKAVRRRHLKYYLDLAEEAESHFISDVDTAWINRIESEYDNIRAALTWALHLARDPVDHANSLRLAGALWLFWYYHSQLSKGRDWLEQALAIAESSPNPNPARAKALVGLATLAHYQGDDDIAVPRLEEAISLWRASGDPVGLAYAISVRGNVAEDSGNYSQAESLFAEARDLFAQVDDQVNVAITLHHLGVVKYGSGDLPTAALLCEEALAVGRRSGDPWITAMAQAYLGLIYAESGALQKAALSLSEALIRFREIGTTERIIEVIRRTAVLAEFAGAPEAALRLLAAADNIAEEIGTAMALPERIAYERTRAAAEAVLGESSAESMLADQELSLDEACAEAECFLNSLG
jgi:predicted ATPase/DNA-binding XRE family transcriptional regulator